MNDTNDMNDMNEASDTTSGRPDRVRRRTAIGVTAGLLAGGTIGLVATMPSLAGAASDAAADPVVVLQDDTDTTDDTETTDERPEPGERLRELLQPLVDDGTIDAAQADAVTEHLVENRPERDERHNRRRHRSVRVHSAVVAEVIGIEAETLRDELRSGKSITEVAEENGVDRQTVVDALVADAQSHVDLAIEHGLDEERAAERLAAMTERIEELVDKTRDVDTDQASDDATGA